MAVFVVLYDTLMFKGKVGYKLFFATLSYILTMISEIIVVFAAGDLTQDVESNYDIIASGTFIEIFVTLFFMIILVIFFNRFIKKDSLKNFGSLIIFPISQMLMLIALVFQFGNYNRYQNEFVVISIIVVTANILSVIADVILYRVNRENAHKKDLEEQLHFLEQKDKLELEYYNLMQTNINETRKIRHDFYNILAAIDTNGDRLGTELKKELTEKLQSTSTAPIYDNHIANLVMQNKKKICEQNNIALQIDAEIPENLNITNFELLRVISNIFDNCIEATKNADGEKAIRIESAVRDNYFFLKAENPVGNTLSKDGEIYATTKTDKKSHGFGMKILSDIAKKYNGTFSAEDKDGKFYTNMILEIPKENA